MKNAPCETGFTLMVGGPRSIECGFTEEVTPQNSVSNRSGPPHLRAVNKGRHSMVGGQTTETPGGRDGHHPRQCKDHNPELFYGMSRVVYTVL